MPGRSTSSRIGDILVKAGLIDDLQLRAALGRVEQWGGRLTGALADMGIVDEDEMAQALSDALRLPLTHLGQTPRDGAALARVSEEACVEHGVFPVSLKARVLTLAMADPTDLGAIDLLAARAGVRVSVVVATEREVTAAIARHYRGEAARAPAPNLARRAVTAEVPAPGPELLLDDAPPPAPKRGNPSANTMLDEMFDDADEAAPAGGFTEAELERLEAARLNQEKTTAILRALEALLAEKGLR